MAQQRRYSFKQIGIHADGRTSVLYTAPAEADIVTTDADLAGFKSLMDPYRASPWIWVFDCRGMKMAHYTNMRFCRALHHILTTEHSTSLQAVWILNINTWLRGVLGFFPLNKAIILPSERLELFIQMKKAGVPDTLVNQLLDAIADK